MVRSPYLFTDASNFHFLDYKALRSNSMENHTSDRTMIRNYSADSCDGEELLLKRRGLVCNGSPWSGAPAGLREEEPSPDSRSQNSSPVHRRSQERRPGRARRALNRSCSVPDSNNPPAFGPSSHAPISMLVADLSEITEDESAPAGWSGRLRQAKPKLEELCVPFADATVEPDEHETDQSCAGDAQTPTALEEADLCSSNHMNKSILCLNEEYQNEVCFLRQNGQYLSILFKAKHIVFHALVNIEILVYFSCLFSH